MNILEHLRKNYHLRTHSEKCDFLHFYGFYMFWKCVSGWVLIKNSYLKVIAMSSLGIEDDFCTISELHTVPRREYTFIWNQMIFTQFLLIFWNNVQQTQVNHSQLVSILCWYEIGNTWKYEIWKCNTTMIFISQWR